MDCNEFSNNILFYLDGELSLKEVTRFEAHLANCDACKLIFDNIAAIYRVVNTEKELQPNPFFYHKLKIRLKNSRHHKTKKILFNVLKPLAVAASIALGIIIGNGDPSNLNTETNDIEIAVQDVALVTPADYSLWISMNEDDEN